MRKIIELLFGKKYYANIVNDMRADFIVSTPFSTKDSALRHRESLRDNRSVEYVCTVAFRTRKPLDVN